jgi:hypothetical protein
MFSAVSVCREDANEIVVSIETFHCVGHFGVVVLNVTGICGN